MEVRFRHLAKDDIPEVIELARYIWPRVYTFMISDDQIEYMLNWMYSPETIIQEIDNGVIYLILDCADEPAGFCSFGPVDGLVCPLHKIYISPDHHRKGLGSICLAEIEKRCRRINGEILELRVNRENRPAISLYQKRGFNIEGKDCADIGGGYVMDDYILRKNLSI